MKTELQNAQELCRLKEEGILDSFARLLEHAHTVQRWRDWANEYGYKKEDLDATITFYKEKGVLE